MLSHIFIIELQQRLPNNRSNAVGLSRRFKIAVVSFEVAAVLYAGIRAVQTFPVTPQSQSPCYKAIKLPFNQTIRDYKNVPYEIDLIRYMQNSKGTYKYPENVPACE